MFGKYTVCATGVKPSATSKGSQVKVENIVMKLQGPFISYSCKRSTTKQLYYYNDEGEEVSGMKTTTNQSTNEVWWRNVIRFKTQCGIWYSSD